MQLLLALALVMSPGVSTGLSLHMSYREGSRNSVGSSLRNNRRPMREPFDRAPSFREGYREPPTRREPIERDFDQRSGAATEWASPEEPLRYYASCASGLENILANELQGPRIRAQKVRVGSRGVQFDGDDATGYRALIWTRTANKVLEVLADSRENVETPDDLYGLARQIEWGSLLLPESSGVRRGAYDDNHDEENGVMTLSVEAVLGQTSMELRHSHFCALTVKNAAVDACREDPNNMQGQRPNVDVEDAACPLVVYLHRGAGTVYRSLGGSGSLHKRGYRSTMHAASLRETLAAGCLMHAGWPPVPAGDDGESFAPSSELRLLDPMCGSGTIAIEAALMARNVAPGLLRLNLFGIHAASQQQQQQRGGGAVRTASSSSSSRHGGPLGLAVLRWHDFNQEAFDGAVQEALECVLPTMPPGLSVCANDWHPAAIALARKDAAIAGVLQDIRFTNDDAKDWTPVTSSSSSSSSPSSGSAALVVSNPPWDLRIEGADEAWAALGAFLRREASGSSDSKSSGDAWLLCGNPEATKALRMKAAAKVPLASGGIDLRLLHYEVLPPRSSKARAGDWPCPSCAVNNFANRQVCFKCGAPKPLGIQAAPDDDDARSVNTIAGRTTTTTTSLAGKPSSTTRSRSTSSASPESVMSAPQPSPQIWSSSPWSEAAPVTVREDVETSAESPPEAAAESTMLVSSVGTLTPEAVATFTVPKLKEALKARRLPVSGLKRDLAERLLANL